MVRHVLVTMQSQRVTNASHLSLLETPPASSQQQKMKFRCAEGDKWWRSRPIRGGATPRSRALRCVFIRLGVHASTSPSQVKPLASLYPVLTSPALACWLMDLFSGVLLPLWWNSNRWHVSQADAGQRKQTPRFAAQSAACMLTGCPSGWPEQAYELCPVVHLRCWTRPWRVEKQALLIWLGEYELKGGQRRRRSEFLTYLLSPSKK